jgi:succinate dehydrogenase/fumarate reductase flavoprotein subunit
MATKKQTAIEWLEEELQEYIISQDVAANNLVIQISLKEYKDLKKSAKQIERDDIVEAFNEGALDGLQLGEEYYNQTFNS